MGDHEGGLRRHVMTVGPIRTSDELVLSLIPAVFQGEGGVQSARSSPFLAPSISDSRLGHC